MKTLLLLRHAKSDWGQAGLRDFDRPLNKRGLRAAPLIGALMRKRNIQPDVVLCSPAERAQQTIKLVADAGGIRTAPTFDKRIYEASAPHLLEVVAGAGDGAEMILVVGHNPGLSELIAVLTGEVREMPTAALACVALEVERWSEAGQGGGRLEWLVTPAELKID